MNRVGLFFGSFDPPHIGHVNVVQIKNLLTLMILIDEELSD